MEDGVITGINKHFLSTYSKAVNYKPNKKTSYSTTQQETMKMFDTINFVEDLSFLQTICLLHGSIP